MSFSNIYICRYYSVYKITMTENCLFFDLPRFYYEFFTQNEDVLRKNSSQNFIRLEHYFLGVVKDVMLGSRVMVFTSTIPPLPLHLASVCKNANFRRSSLTGGIWRPLLNNDWKVRGPTDLQMSDIEICRTNSWWKIDTSNFFF